MTMYERIKDLRTKKGLSQQDLARMTGYQDRSSIAKIESGSVDLPQSKIVAFASALGVTPAQLMGLEELSDDSTMMRLLPHEREVILAYRAKPHRQEAVDLLLEIPPAAKSKQA